MALVAWGLWLLTTPAWAQSGEEDAGWFESAMQAVVQWCVCFFVELARPIVDVVLGWLPTNTASGAGSLVWWLGVVDQWFPVTLSISLLSSYITFLLAFILVKMVLKLIPAIG